MNYNQMGPLEQRPNESLNDYVDRAFLPIQTLYKVPLNKVQKESGNKIEVWLEDDSRNVLSPIIKINKG
jgi:hypothetical protein